MPLLGADLAQPAASLDQLFLPKRQLAFAVVSDGARALVGGWLSSLRRPGAVLDPIGNAFDQPSIPDRAKHPRQIPLFIGALSAPEFILRLRTPLVDFVQSFDRNIDIPHSAEMSVQPPQFIL